MHLKVEVLKIFDLKYFKQSGSVYQIGSSKPHPWKLFQSQKLSFSPAQKSIYSNHEAKFAIC